MFERVEDMTPARFDFLYVLYRHREHYLPDIRRALGLARQTVWKLMQRLVELGLITKRLERHPRCLWIELTDEGRRRVHQAFSAAFSEDAPLPLHTPSEKKTSIAATSIEKPTRRRLGVVPALLAAYRDATAEQKRGREVGKIYSEYTRLRTPKGKKRRRRYLLTMERFIGEAEAMAIALGNDTRSIYEINYREMSNPDLLLMPSGEIVDTRDPPRRHPPRRFAWVSRRSRP